jgi:hypothetical protein
MTFWSIQVHDDLGELEKAVKPAVKNSTLAAH